MITRFDNQNTYCLFVYKSNKLSIQADNTRFEVHALEGHNSRWARVVHEQTVIPLRALAAGCTLLHSFGNVAVLRRGIRNVVTVHDLKPFDRNEGRLPSARDYYMRAIIAKSLRAAELVLPISNFTAQSIRNRFAVPLDRLSVVPNIVSSTFRRQPEHKVKAFRHKYLLSDQFWVYVANFYPHKNHELLLRAYTSYRDKVGGASWPLVLCGSPGPERDRVRRLVSNLGLTEHISFITGLSDEEMPTLYSSAGALIFPSAYEGCGLPLLEAMACGCPIVASSIPAVLEFTKEASRLFETGSIEGSALAMAAISTNAALRYTLGGLGILRAEAFRDHVIAEKLLDAYALANARAKQIA